jgi:predicted transcriptional regulator
MDVIHRLGEASVADVRSEMTDAPSYSTVRALMRVLTKKGYLVHSTEGLRYVYRSTTSRDEARASALERVLSTFFDRSPTKAMAALMELSAADMSEQELDELERLIQDARRERR